MSLERAAPDQTTRHLTTIVAVMIASGLLLRMVSTARWFDLYGVATIILAGSLPLLAALMRGLERRGRNRWLAALAVAPMVVAALVQIGYWTAFFSSLKTGIPLGLGRLMLGINAGFIGPAVMIATIAVVTWVAWLASGPHARRRTS